MALSVADKYRFFVCLQARRTVKAIPGARGSRAKTIKELLKYGYANYEMYLIFTVTELLQLPLSLLFR